MASADFIASWNCISSRSNSSFLSSICLYSLSISCFDSSLNFFIRSSFIWIRFFFSWLSLSMEVLSWLIYLSFSSRYFWLLFYTLILFAASFKSATSFVNCWVSYSSRSLSICNSSILLFFYSRIFCNVDIYWRPAVIKFFVLPLFFGISSLS